MRRLAGIVAARLEKIAPARAGDFRRRLRRLQDRLGGLDDDFRRGLRHCRSRAMVTSHEAFGYLARRYGLTQVGIAGLDPEAEPAPQRIAEVARYVRTHRVSTVFFERLVAPDVAETVAREAGARATVLDPIETAPQSGDYVDAMHADLRTLTTALGCR
jgi:zinc transport system substrate-binding protein